MKTPNNLNQMQHLKELSENITKSYADILEKNQSVLKAVDDYSISEYIYNNL